MLIDVSKEPTVLNLKVRRQQEKAQSDLQRSSFELLKKIGKACHKRFAAGRRLADGELEAASKTFKDEFDSSIASIVSYDLYQEATRTRPKGDAIEHLRSFVGPDVVTDFDAPSLPETVKSAIWNSRLYATRKLAILECRRSPFVWSRHAVARMHERIDNELDAEREIAQTILLETFMLSLAAVVVLEENLPERLALPCQSGLLLGDVQTISAYQGGSFRYRFTRDATHAFDAPTMYIYRREEPRLSPGWSVRTFIGPNEMREEQNEYAARFQEIRQRFKEHADLAVHYQSYGHSALTKWGDASDVDQTRMENAVTEAKQAIRTLLSVPRFSTAIGNDWSGYEPTIIPWDVEEETAPMPGF